MTQTSRPANWTPAWTTTTRLLPVSERGGGGESSGAAGEGSPKELWSKDVHWNRSSWKNSVRAGIAQSVVC